MSAVVELRAGPATVMVCPEDGGRIGQIDLDGEPLLRGPEFAHLGWLYWGSYPLLPWSNRIEDGSFRFDGRHLHVPVNHDDGTALHGLVAWRPWTVDAAAADRAELSIAVAEGCYDVAGRQSLRVTPDGLDLTLEVENRGADPVPVGLGIHPWFRGGPVRVPADRFWPGAGPMPEGLPVAVTDAEDLRTSRVPPVMDRCYTGLTDSWAEVGGIRLHWSGPVTQMVVFSGVPGWVCVEPVTMANNGFRLADDGIAGTGVIPLDPGASTRVTYRFDWGQYPHGQDGRSSG